MVYTLQNLLHLEHIPTMISSITEYLEELKESFVPTVAKAEDDVDEKEVCYNLQQDDLFSIL